MSNVVQLPTNLNSPWEQALILKETTAFMYANWDKVKDPRTLFTTNDPQMLRAIALHMVKALEESMVEK